MTPAQRRATDPPRATLGRRHAPTWKVRARALGADVVNHHERWTALMTAVMLASAAAGLWWLEAHAAQVDLTAHLPLVITAGCTYTALTLLVAIRRRIDRPTGAVIVIALAALMLAEGTSYPDPSLRWVCLAFLTVLPLLANVLLGRTGAVLATTACVGIAITIAMGLPSSPLVRSYVASTMATLVCIPVLVVGVLMAQLRRARSRADTAAITDQLTGLLNRRGLQQTFPALLAAATPGHHVSVTMIDLDHFKAVNDGWGHLVGDEVLTRTAAALRAAVRADDLLARFGGEEFVWVGCHAHPSGAMAAAERLRIRLASSGTAGGGPKVTASFGVVVAERRQSAPQEAEAVRDHLEALLLLADRALYRAKVGGRDRVEEELPADVTPTPAITSQHVTSQG